MEGVGPKILRPIKIFGPNIMIMYTYFYSIFLSSQFCFFKPHTPECDLVCDTISQFQSKRGTNSLIRAHAHQTLWQLGKPYGNM